MVRHMLFIRFLPEIRQASMDEKIARLQAAFAAMPGRVPGLRKAEIGRNITAGRFDACLYCEFDKPEDLAAYQSHPLHLALGEMANSWLEEKTCVDYRIAE